MTGAYTYERGPGGTAYAWTEVPIGNGLVFYIDGNSKITASNGTYAKPVPNAFSLPHQSTCPGATPSCLASCYVHGLEKHAPATYARYRQNERALHRVLFSPIVARRAASALGAWIDMNVREFRWHVSGDVMHSRHARWIADVCNASRARHWIYTKSVGALIDLAEPENLVVNLSADRDNYADMRAAAVAFGLRVCYMSQSPDDVPPDLRPWDVIFPDYPARGRELMKCRDCGWLGSETPWRTEGGNKLCPNGCAHGSLTLEPTEHPWWQARTPAERRLVCPPDFFGQSEAHRCGPCRKCIDAPGVGAWPAGDVLSPGTLPGQVAS